MNVIETSDRSTDPREALRSSGIYDVAADEAPLLRLAFASVAGRVRERAVRSVGLVPADDGVAVPAVALHLGRALAARSRRPVAVVDTLGGWTCARALIDSAPLDGGCIAESRLLHNLYVLTPRIALSGGSLWLRGGFQGAMRFEHLVFDLTGVDHLGEHLVAFDAIDAVAIVVRRGRTTMPDVTRWLRDVLGERNLGVLLTGV